MTAEAMANSKVAVLVLCFTFVAGIATGAGAMVSFGPRPHGPPPPHFGGPGARRLPPPFEELGLSAEQRTKAETIFEKHRPKLEALFEETRPKMNALRSEMDAELVPLLTDAQRAKWDELKARRPGPPPPP
jgi:Spy/CpxP family protein refolding chaperone